MTPTSQMNNNIRNLIASAKAPVVDKLQECMEENRVLRKDIATLEVRLEEAKREAPGWLDCTCPPGIREGVLGGPICHACERQLEELYGDEIPF